MNPDEKNRINIPTTTYFFLITHPTIISSYFSSSFFREAKVQRAVTLCAADEDTQREKKSVKNDANVNFTGVALYSAMYAKKKS